MSEIKIVRARDGSLHIHEFASQLPPKRIPRRVLVWREAKRRIGAAFRVLCGERDPFGYGEW